MLPPLDVLLSYAYHSRADLQALRTAIGPDAVMLIDSGAYTAFTKGIPIDRAAYAEFLREHAGRYSAAVTLDVIGDVAATRRNTAWLHEQGVKVMPVHTVGAPLAEFDAAVRDTGYVAIGGMVGTAKRSQADYLAVLTRRARELGGTVHALGVGRSTLLRQTRPFSSDVSTISQLAVHAQISLWDGRRTQPIGLRNGAALRTHRELLRAYGLDVVRLANGTGFARDNVIALFRAGLLSTQLQGAWIRNGVEPVPTPQGVQGLPGPRLLVALGSDLIRDVALQLAQEQRDGAELPRIARKLLPRVLVASSA